MNISALVKDLSVSQSSFYLIKEFNKCLSCTSMSMSVFYTAPAIMPVEPCFACKSVSFLAGYNGVVIADSVEQAEIALKASNAADRYLYLWDMPWVRKRVDFDRYMKVMRDDRLKIIARSNEHADCISNFCNKTCIGTVDNWDMPSILNLIGENA